MVKTSKSIIAKQHYLNARIATINNLFGIIGVFDLAGKPK